MLPSPPLTDPDERISRIRFFTRKLRSRNGILVDVRDGSGYRASMARARPRQIAVAATPCEPFLPYPHELVAGVARPLAIGRSGAGAWWNRRRKQTAPAGGWSRCPARPCPGLQVLRSSSSLSAEPDFCPAGRRDRPIDVGELGRRRIAFARQRCGRQVSPASVGCFRKCRGRRSAPGLPATSARAVPGTNDAGLSRHHSVTEASARA